LVPRPCRAAKSGSARIGASDRHSDDGTIVPYQVDALQAGDRTVSTESSVVPAPGHHPDQVALSFVALLRQGDAHRATATNEVENAQV
jgi:hypothetical protein